jgi:hypothetical protein
MVVLILVVLWIVVLTPGAVRWYRARQPTESIDSFHQQLHLLERTGPKLVEPAYRLETVQSRTGVAVGQSGLPSVSSRPGRPNLVLLSQADDDPRVGGVPAGGTPGDDVVEDASGVRYHRVLGPEPGGWAPAGWAGGTYGSGGGVGSGSRIDGPAGRGRGSKSPEDARRRRLAQRRRRTLIMWTAGVLVLTAMLGAVPSLHALWVVTGLAALGLAGYVGLVAYAQLLESEHPRAGSWHGSEVRPYGGDYGYSAFHGAGAGPSTEGGYSISAYGHVPEWDDATYGNRLDRDQSVLVGAGRAAERDDRRVAAGR